MYLYPTEQGECLNRPRLDSSPLGLFRVNPNQTDVWMPCQDWGVAGEATSIYLGSRARFSPKIMFPYKMASIPTD